MATILFYSTKSPQYTVIRDILSSVFVSHLRLLYSAVELHKLDNAFTLNSEILQCTQ